MSNLLKLFIVTVVFLIIFAISYAYHRGSKEFVAPKAVEQIDPPVVAPPVPVK